MIRVEALTGNAWSPSERKRFFHYARYWSEQWEAQQRPRVFISKHFKTCSTKRCNLLSVKWKEKWSFKSFLHVKETQISLLFHLQETFSENIRRFLPVQICFFMYSCIIQTLQIHSFIYIFVFRIHKMLNLFKFFRHSMQLATTSQLRYGNYRFINLRKITLYKSWILNPRENVIEQSFKKSQGR